MRRGSLVIQWLAPLKNHGEREPLTKRAQALRQCCIENLASANIDENRSIAERACLKTALAQLARGSRQPGAEIRKDSGDV